MKKIVLASLLVLQCLTATAVECTGERRETVGSEVKVIKKELIEQNLPGMTKLELDIEEAYFSVQLDGDDVLAMITLGPDYMDGNLSRSSFNSRGEMKLSYVSPYKTLILECKR